MICISNFTVSILTMIDTIYPSVHGIFSWNDEGLVRKMDVLCSLSILLHPLEKQRITISIDIINRLPFPFHPHPREKFENSFHQVGFHPFVNLLFQ